MDGVIKVLKIIVLTIAIIIGVGVIWGSVFVYKGMQSGNLKSYVTKTVLEKVAPNTNLTPEQKDMLEEGNYEGLVSDMGENITPEQVDCAVEILGVERANQLLITKDPTPQEVLKLSKCL